jgi:hypothetical protein
MKPKKILTWVAIVFVAYYLATQPEGAAHVVHSAFNGLHNAGNSLATFVNSL